MSSGDRFLSSSYDLRLRRRVRRGKYLRILCFTVTILVLCILSSILLSLLRTGSGSFFQSYIRISADIPSHLTMEQARPLFMQSLRERFPELHSSKDLRSLRRLFSFNSDQDFAQLAVKQSADYQQRLHFWLLAADDVNFFHKRDKADDDKLLQENFSRLSLQQRSWTLSLEKSEDLRLRFNSGLFTNSDSREPERAGLAGALLGSFYLMIVTLVLAFPLAISAAIYLEELAPRNWLLTIFELNINNLAAVPSIVFGILGATIFLATLGWPRASSLVGGVVLCLMTVPTIVIATRSALSSVSMELREAGLALGATRLQTVFHHVLPSAMPGILTGSVIGMAQALGETAPLLMIGMVAFIPSFSLSILDPHTALPVQIYLWADSPERAFAERASAACLVLLAFMLAMNALAVFLRGWFEKRRY